ncbi:MAG: hypothetical protein ACRD3O_20265, partial [Terriglobia bacterium]
CTGGSAECEAESGKNFEGASESGERVFFTSTQKLTAGAVDGTAGGDAAEGGGCANIKAPDGCNLYEYNFGLPEGERLTDISDEVAGVTGIAEDGAHVYFVSRATITGDALAGQPNLYVYDTLNGETKFIATLKSSEGALWSRAFKHPAEVAGGEGQFLLFTSSKANLTTPDDTTKTTQLFEYDATTSELVRVSQGENGYNENGNDVTGGVYSPTLTATSTALGGSGRNFKSTVNQLEVSENGDTVFFQSSGALSPRARSAEAGCNNVYEFHTNGDLGEGVVSLISSGEGENTGLVSGKFCGDSVQAVDGAGENVLFSTASSLVAGDVDGGQPSIYDARVGGGFPPVPASASCEDGCEGSVSSPAPLFASPGSASLTGAGNAAPSSSPAAVPPSAAGKAPVKKRVSKCAKGRKLSHGKCVKVKAKRKVKPGKANRRAGK